MERRKWRSSARRPRVVRTPHPGLSNLLLFLAHGVPRSTRGLGLLGRGDALLRRDGGGLAAYEAEVRQLVDRSGEGDEERLAEARQEHLRARPFGVVRVDRGLPFRFLGLRGRERVEACLQCRLQVGRRIRRACDDQRDQILRVLLQSDEHLLNGHLLLIPCRCNRVC